MVSVMSNTQSSKFLDVKASIYIFFGSASLGLIPLLTVLTNGNRDIFLFNAYWSLGTFVAFVSVLIVKYGKLFHKENIITFYNKVLDSIFDHKGSFFLSLLMPFTLLFFVSSTIFIDESVATIIYESWPIILVILLLRLSSKKTKRNKKTYAITPRNMILILSAFGGYTFVIFAQTGDEIAGRTNAITILLGVILAILGALTTSFMAFQFDLGENLDLKEIIYDKRNISDGSSEFAGFLIIRIIGLLIIIPVSYFVSQILKYSNFELNFNGVSLAIENISNFDLLIIFFAGTFVSLGGLLSDKATSMTSNLGVQSLRYLVPLFGLLWLYIFMDQIEVKFDYVAIGAIIILLVSVLVNFETEKRWGFTVLGLGLLSFGTIVYFRDSFFEAQDFIWLWRGGEYYAFLGIVATVFTLLLSFRIDRLSTRMREEEKRLFSIVSKSEILIQKSILNSMFVVNLQNISLGKQEERISSYNLVMDEMEKAKLSLDDCVTDSVNRSSVSKELSKLASEINLFANSKQYVREFAESAAIVALSLFAISLSILSRPKNLIGISGLLGDLFAVLFATTIAFLTVNLIDLSRDRNRKLLKNFEIIKSGVSTTSSSIKPFHRLNFVDENSRQTEWIATVSVSLMTIIVFIILYIDKWNII